MPEEYLSLRERQTDIATNSHGTTHLPARHQHIKATLSDPEFIEGESKGGFGFVRPLTLYMSMSFHARNV